ncbi:MAG TPA: class I SAM-dependent methyltransferase [Gemmatimonadales bacterium]|nr:class I SAM-dependent methyltransferase [Gemmatimonadales bacterium]
MTAAAEPAGFDAHAATYDAELDAGLSATGEDKLYFARGRLMLVAERLRTRGASAAAVLDFGCGDGTGSALMHELLGASRVVGVDVSDELLAIARRRHGSSVVSFTRVDDLKGTAFNLAFCNGVFHHIPLRERAAAMVAIHGALRPGGYFALWENNPWNPGTRYVMHRVPFDRDALTITPPEARRLAAAAGFEVIETAFAFVFPRALRWLRALEPACARLPLGGQYLVLCRKRESPTT